MARRTLEGLGSMVKSRRGSRRLRETAAEIGISSPTLMRIENGRMPDIGTFSKICRWLDVDPSELMGLNSKPALQSEKIQISAHLRSGPSADQETLKALVSMIRLVAENQPQPDRDLPYADI